MTRTNQAATKQAADSGGATPVGVLRRCGVTPMKGTRHAALDALELTATGPAGDRVLCLVDLAQQAVVRTKQHPELLTVTSRWDGSELVVDLPGVGTVHDRPLPAADPAPFDYWGRDNQLVVQGSTVAEAFSRFLDRDVRLARTTAPGDVVYGAPVTVVTTSELDELAGRSGHTSLRDEDARFRATLTVDDAALPGALTEGARVRVGDALVELADEIPRCVLIDRHPVSGEAGTRLLATLAHYRRRGSDLMFGRYARVVVPGTVRPGDPVTVQRAAS